MKQAIFLINRYFYRVNIQNFHKLHSLLPKTKPVQKICKIHSIANYGIEIQYDEYVNIPMTYLGSKFTNKSKIFITMVKYVALYQNFQNLKFIITKSNKPYICKQTISFDLPIKPVLCNNICRQAFIFVYVYK